MVTFDLIRFVGFALGFVLIGGLVGVSWVAWRTRADTDTDGRVLTGIGVFSFGCASLVVSTVAHLTDEVHRREVKWITPVLLVAELAMAAGLILVLRGQKRRAAEESGPPRLVPGSRHPLDRMTDDAG